jgi:hypothetical protein
MGFHYETLKKLGLKCRVQAISRCWSEIDTVHTHELERLPGERIIIKIVCDSIENDRFVRVIFMRLPQPQHQGADRHIPLPPPSGGYSVHPNHRDKV